LAGLQAFGLLELSGWIICFAFCLASRADPFWVGNFDGLACLQQFLYDGKDLFIMAAKSFLDRPVVM